MENRHVHTAEGRRGWDEWREQHGNVYTTTRKTDARGNLLYDSGSSPVLCDLPEGWEVGGRGHQYNYG